MVTLIDKLNLRRLSFDSRSAALFGIGFIGVSVQMDFFSWTGNEIHYFDLSFRSVAPSEFSDHHSVYDSSNARFAGFGLLGVTISTLGFDLAKLLLASFCTMLMTCSVWLLMRARNAGVAEAFLVFAGFIYFGQSLLGGEWIFGSVEAKSFAYPAVIAGLAYLFSGKWLLPCLLCVLATYFHFLVGGFWAVAMLLFMLLDRRGTAEVLRFAGIFAALVLPLVVLIGAERMADAGALAVDFSVAEVYAAFRNPHHIAPFAGGREVFMRDWFPGIWEHASLSAVFALIWLRSSGSDRVHAAWLCAMNAYIPIAILVAWLDRDTHVVAPLYLFRPSSLILFLSLLGLAIIALQSVPKQHYRRAVLLAAILFAVPVGKQIVAFVRSPPVFGLEATLPADAAGLVDWLRSETAPDATVIIQPRLSDDDWFETVPPFAGFERLTGRGFVVNYKFVPTGKSDVAKWYTDIRNRAAAFDEGDCDRLKTLGADFVVVRDAVVWDRVAHCVTEVFANGSYRVGQMK
ncbi:MAG TPA: hypothetical protein DDY14_08355 [Chromatiaceae bacterium]|nr:hypothetical protein [Chromatiaceae bacterium]